MDKSTSELTVEYIKEHPHIKSCLKKGLINYSSLARLVSKELDLENKTSKEAVLIASRRYRTKLESELSHDQRIRCLLEKSELSIRNKIAVLVIEKKQGFDPELQKDTLYVLEGSDNFTVITHEKGAEVIRKRYRNRMMQDNKDMALISIKSPKEIESTIGVVSYLTSLFAENGVNISEFLSCWRDTLFIIDKKDAVKAMEFLRF